MAGITPCDGAPCACIGALCARAHSGETDSKTAHPSRLVLTPNALAAAETHIPRLPATASCLRIRERAQAATRMRNPNPASPHSHHRSGLSANRKDRAPGSNRFPGLKIVAHFRTGRFPAHVTVGTRHPARILNNHMGLKGWVPANRPAQDVSPSQFCRI